MLDVVGSVVVYKNQVGEVAAAASSFLNTRLNCKLYVIDNSPDDRAREACRDERIVYIFNGRNLGFGAGHNVALRASMGEAPYHVVLNPDVYFDAGVLEGLLQFAGSRPDAGLLMPKILNPDGSIQHLCKKLPAPSDLILRRFLPDALKRLWVKRFAEYELRDQDYGRILSVPVLSGCFLLINSEVLSRVGLFDERFFMYLEDVDFCRRVRQHYDTIYYPGVAIYHGYAKGSYRSSRLMMRHIVSAVRYFNKWGWFSDAERVRVNQDSPNATSARALSDM